MGDEPRRSEDSLQSSAQASFFSFSFPFPSPPAAASPLEWSGTPTAEQ